MAARGCVAPPEIPPLLLLGFYKLELNLVRKLKWNS